jgi:4-methyl-5(b-hydroxyethyl)-thiazole monophosphate biosynthesis
MIYLILGNGFEETEAIAPLDCLRRAELPVCTLGIGGGIVESSHGVQMRADRSIDGLTQADMEEAELVILPGGLGGVSEIIACAPAVELVRYAAEHDRWIAAICAAPTIFGGMGLLEGKKAVCYPGMEEGLYDAEVQLGHQVVVDGKIVTAEAAGSAVEFGLTLVRCLAGQEKANEVAESIHFHGTF